MTWLFSEAMMKDYGNSPSLQEQGGESLGECFSDGEPFAQLNVMPTPHKFWRNDKTMESSRLSQFGLTLRLLTESHGEAVLMSYLEDSPARTSVVPEVVTVLMERKAVYGENFQGSLARFDPDTHSLRTAQCSLIEGLTEFYATLPRWGSMRNGALYLRPMSVLPICVNEFGFWPTPDASCGRRGWSRTIAEKVKSGDKERKSGAKIGSSLSWEPRLLPDYSLGMRLNPDWLEWLMGWPIAHTALLPLAMDKFQEWQQQHGGF